MMISKTLVHKEEVVGMMYDGRTWFSKISLVSKSLFQVVWVQMVFHSAFQAKAFRIIFYPHLLNGLIITLFMHDFCLLVFLVTAIVFIL